MKEKEACLVYVETNIDERPKLKECLSLLSDGDTLVISGLGDVVDSEELVGQLLEVLSEQGVIVTIRTKLNFVGGDLRENIPPKVDSKTKRREGRYSESKMTKAVDNERHEVFRRKAGRKPTIVIPQEELNQLLDSGMSYADIMQKIEMKYKHRVSKSWLSRMNKRREEK